MRALNDEILLEKYTFKCRLCDGTSECTRCGEKHLWKLTVALRAVRGANVPTLQTVDCQVLQQNEIAI